MSGRSASAVPDRAALGPTRHRLRLRVGLMLAGGLAMLSGLYGGLVRIGLDLPAGGDLAQLHGPLMVSGLFGTLISLERAVAIKEDWAYLAPACSALATLMLLFGVPVPVGAALYVLAAAILTAASARIALAQPALFTLVLLAGAGCWLVGNLSWALGVEISGLVGWWLAFFVATIAAERLELSRFVQVPRRASSLFVAAIATLLTGAGLGFVDPLGQRLFAAGLVAICLWLLRYDIARVTVRRTGQTRFFAVAMLSGYAWLGLSGLGLLAGAGGALSLGYDLTLHMVLIGFVLSMVFGHALIILPAVAGVKLRYHRALYGPLGLLHLSVVARVAGGALDLAQLRALSGIGTALSIGLFAATLAWSAMRSAPDASKPAAR